MDNQIFRQKSVDRLRSPEELKDYLHVTSPALWTVVIAVLLLVVSLLIWSGFASVESYAKGTASAKNGTLIVTLPEDSGVSLETGMVVSIGDKNYDIVSVGRNEEGRPLAIADADVPDGNYEVKLGYRKVRMIRMLFN